MPKKVVKKKAASKKTPKKRPSPAATASDSPQGRVKKATKKKATRKRAVIKKAAGKPLPVELSGEVAKRVWLDTEPRLRDRLNLLDIDERILVLYCNCWQLLTECQAVLNKEGRYITMEDTGYVSRHPAAVDEKNTIAQIRQLAAELGMTPKSGNRVKVRDGTGDVLQAFLSQRPD